MEPPGLAVVQVLYHGATSTDQKCLALNEDINNMSDIIISA